MKKEEILKRFANYLNSKVSMGGKFELNINASSVMGDNIISDLKSIVHNLLSEENFNIFKIIEDEEFEGFDGNQYYFFIADVWMSSFDLKKYYRMLDHPDVKKYRNTHRICISNISWF